MMAGPAFGFSVGNFIAGAEITNDVRKAFKDTHGASSTWKAKVLYLEGLESTLKQLQDHATGNSNSTTSSLVDKLLQLISRPLENIKQALDKYRASLESQSSKSMFTKARKIISFTLKDVAGEVKNLRVQIEQPLQQVELLLALEQIKLIETIPNMVCVQTVAALLSADVPVALKNLLSKASDQEAHGKDELLKQQKDLQTCLLAAISDVQVQLATLKDAAAEVETTMEFHRSSHLRTLQEMRNSIAKLADIFEARADGLDTTLRQLSELVAVLQASLRIASSQRHDVPDANGTTEQKLSMAQGMKTLLTTVAISVISSLATGAAAVTVAQRAHSQTPRIGSLQYTECPSYPRPEIVPEIDCKDSASYEERTHQIKVVWEPQSAESGQEEHSWQNSESYLPTYDDTVTTVDYHDAPTLAEGDAFMGYYKRVWLSKSTEGSQTNGEHFGNNSAAYPPTYSHNDNTTNSTNTAPKSLMGEPASTIESEPGTQSRKDMGLSPEDALLKVWDSGDDHLLKLLTEDGHVYNPGTGDYTVLPDPAACPFCDMTFRGKRRRGNIDRDVRLKHGMYSCGGKGCK